MKENDYDRITFKLEELNKDIKYYEKLIKPNDITINEHYYYTQEYCQECLIHEAVENKIIEFCPMRRCRYNWSIQGYYITPEDILKSLHKVKMWAGEKYSDYMFGR